MNVRTRILDAAALAAFLSVVAAVAPRPWFLTDESAYEATAHQIFVPDCSNLQCGRLLAPWIVGRLPGPPLFRWRFFAVVATTGAALALSHFCLAAGLTPRSARFAAWLVALGFGPLLAVFNPYTPDPLMYFLGPVVMTALWQGRRVTAFVMAAIGVFGKEVAAAPLWIFSLFALLRGQWGSALRVFAMAFGATLIWAWLQLWLVIEFNYSYASSKSADLLHGGDAVIWWGELGLRGGVLALAASLGALLLLMPSGWARATRDLRLTAAATLPAALVLCYVQQPDRALWNFHYAMIPLAVLALEQLPDLWCWLFIAFYGLANLRIGAQWRFLPNARYAALGSVAIAAAAATMAIRQPRRSAALIAGAPVV
jgi:hypothetical protein